LEELLESHQAVLSNLTDSRVGSKTWHNSQFNNVSNTIYLTINPAIEHQRSPLDEYKIIWCQTEWNYNKVGCSAIHGWQSCQDPSKILTRSYPRSYQDHAKILHKSCKIMEWSCKIFPWSCRIYVRSWHDLGTNPARSCHDSPRSYHKSCKILPW
jgi:hypothetical protein